MKHQILFTHLLVLWFSVGRIKLKDVEPVNIKFWLESVLIPEKNKIKKSLKSKPDDRALQMKLEGVEETIKKLELILEARKLR